MNTLSRFMLGLLLAALVVSFTACRNAGYGDFDYVTSPELGSGVIRGTVTRTPGLSIRAAASVPLAGAEVWLEEYPSIRGLTDAQGNYRILGVPAGIFRVVAKFNDNVAVYKMRSNTNTVAENDEIVVDLGLLKATNIVRGVMTDESGNLLQQGTPVYLWGEIFYIGQNGSFVTPPLPTFEGLNSIFDLVLNPGRSNQFNIPVSFVSQERPLEVALTVPTSGNASVETLPKALLVATKDGAIETQVMKNEQLTITAVISPVDTTSENLSWSATQGTFGDPVVSSGSWRVRSWTAPATAGIATLSLRITAPDGKMATATLPILVEVPVTYGVTFNSNDGTAVDQQIIDEGQTVQEPAPPSKPGHTFAGWYKNEACTNAWTFATDTVTAATTLYAKWTVNSYAVTFNSNDGTAVDQQNINHGGKVTEPANPTKVGHAFAGWFKEEALTNAWNFANDTVTAATTLYAKWTQNPTYTVTYDGNGNTSGSAPSDANVYEAGTNVTVAANTGNLAKTGFTFAGWNTKADGSGTDRAAASSFSMGQANVALFADWATNSYTVTYDGNGNTGGAIPVDENSPHEYGTNVTVLGNTGNLVKDGYTFTGWNTKMDGTGTSYAAAANFEMGAANTTLFAQWKDTIVPTISVLSPATGASVSSGNGKLAITFSETIQKCTGDGIGNIVIYNAADAVIETIRIDNAAVEVSGTVATITPSVFLAAGTSYYVKIDGTCFQDAAGNKFAGIADKTTWAFTRPAFLVQPANAGDQEANGIVFDAAGNFYVSGYTNGAVNDQALVGVSDYFIAKYSSEGTLQKTVQAGAALKSIGLAAHSLTISDSSLYLAGGADGAVDDQAHKGSYDGIFFKYSTGLDHSWTRIVGTSNWDSGGGVAVGTNNDVFLTGFVGGHLDNQHNYNAGTTHDVFLKKVGTDGNALFTKLLNDAAPVSRNNTYDENNDAGCEINATKDYVYLAGRTNGTFWETAGKGSNDVAVAKMSTTDGAISWAKSYGGSDSDEPTDVLLDSNENVFVLANSKSSTDDFEAIPTIGDYDIVLLKLSKTDGSLVSKYRFGTTSEDKCFTMAKDADNNIYIAGYTKGAFSGALAGTIDMFVMRVNPTTGNVDWNVQLGKAAAETTGIALAVNGSNVYVCGKTTGGFDGNAPTGSDYFVLRFDKDTGNRN